MSTRKKVVVIGGGNVGAATAHYAGQVIDGEVCLIDVVPQLTEYKAYDFELAKPHFSQYTSTFKGSTDFAILKDADVIIHTAGIARKPGMDRMDLIKTNVKIAENVSKEIVTHAPNAMLIVVANPLDVITMACYQSTQFPKNRVIGMAGVLDSARYCYFVAEALGIKPSQVRTTVLGGHGDAMVPLTQYSSINGVALTHFLNDDVIASMEDRTCHGGAEIVKLLKTGSAYYAPAASAVHMAKAMLTGKKKIFTASVLLQGEYGHHDIFLGVPVIVGSSGLEKIIEVTLSEYKKEAIQKSAEMVREGLAQFSSIA